MITSITGDSLLDDQRASFGWTEDGHLHALYITQDGEDYTVVHDPGAAGSGVEETVWPSWNGAVAAWSRQVALVIDRLDPALLFTGPDVQKITGMSAPGLSLLQQRLRINGSRKGQKKLYGKYDVMKMLRRPGVGRAVRTDTPATDLALIREAVKQPSVLPDVVRDMLVARYGLDGCPPHSLQEIGDDVGISKEAVRRQIDRTIKRLRQEVDKQKTKRDT